MRPIRRNYDIAGAFVMLSGLLYIPIFMLESWNTRTQAFLVMGLFFLIAGLVLRKRHRWLAYVLYVLCLVAILVTLIAMGTSTIGTWWWVVLMLIQVLAVYNLFRILWAPKVPVE